MTIWTPDQGKPRFEWRPKLNFEHPVGNPIGYWLLNEGGGDVAYDISQSTLHGSLQSSPAWNDSGLLFDGSTDYILLGWGVYGFDYNTPFSIFAIVRTTATGERSLLTKMDSDAGYVGYSMAFSDKVILTLNNSWPAQAIQRSTSSTFNDGLFHNILATYDGSGNRSGINIYVDGVLQAMTDAASASISASIANSAPAVIGCRRGGGGSTDIFYSGTMATVSVYNREIPPALARELTAHPYGVDDNPLLYVPGLRVYSFPSVLTTTAPTTLPPTTLAPTTLAPTTLPTTAAPTTLAPTTLAPTTLPPTTISPTTLPPTTLAPTTLAPTTLAPTTLAPTTLAPTTLPPTTSAPTTLSPTTAAPTTIPSGNDFTCDSNFVALWRHEAGASGLEKDSLGGNDLTNSGVSADTGDKQEGGASGDYVPNDYQQIADADLDADFPFSAGSGEDEMGILLHFKCDSIADGTTQALAAKYDSFNNKRSWALQLRRSGANYVFRMLFGYNAGASVETIDTSVLTFTTGQWYHIYFGVVDSTKSWKIRLWNGVSASNESGNYSNAISFTDSAFNLGCIRSGGGTANYLDGHLDEVVMSKVTLLDVTIDRIRMEIFDSCSITTVTPTTLAPTTISTTAAPTTLAPTTLAPTTPPPTTLAPTTISTTLAPTTVPTTTPPTTIVTTLAPTTVPTTAPPTTLAPTTPVPTTLAPTTVAPTTVLPTTVAPTTFATSLAPTTLLTTSAPTTVAAPVICTKYIESIISDTLYLHSPITKEIRFHGNLCG